MYTTYLNSVFFVHGYAHVSVLICTQVTMTTTTIILRFDIYILIYGF